MNKLRWHVVPQKKGYRTIGFSAGKLFAGFNRGLDGSVADRYEIFVSVCLWFFWLDVSYSYSVPWARKESGND